VLNLSKKSYFTISLKQVIELIEESYDRMLANDIKNEFSTYEVVKELYKFNKDFQKFYCDKNPKKWSSEVLKYIAHPSYIQLPKDMNIILTILAASDRIPFGNYLINDEDL
jgi:hypothetical protein